MKNLIKFIENEDINISNFEQNEKHTIKILLKILFIILVIQFYFYISFNDRLIEKYKILEQRKIIHSKYEKIKIKSIKKDPDYEYFCCFCSMGRQENLYARELISYYKSIGVEKFILGDNNLPNTEKLSDVLKDYINSGFVEIVDLLGRSIKQGEFFADTYQKYKNKCKWISFFDFDEYLVLKNNKQQLISLQEFLTNKIFKKCDTILFNWLMYTDNDFIYYNKGLLRERFITPDYNNYANRFVKSIVRGNLKVEIFGKGKSNHQPNEKLKLCNPFGKKANYTLDSIFPPTFQNAYLMHYNTKTVEEYAIKIKRGYPGNKTEPVKERIFLFFIHNKYSRKKFQIFEKKFNKNFYYLEQYIIDKIKNKKLI